MTSLAGRTGTFQRAGAQDESNRLWSGSKAAEGRPRCCSAPTPIFFRPSSKAKPMR